MIRAFSVADRALTSDADYGPHRLLIDSPAPGSGQVFDWSNLAELASGRKFILAGGLNPGNVGDAIRVARPWGVDVATGVESAPGRKDPAKVRKFIAAARKAAAALGPESDPFELAETGPFDGDRASVRGLSGDDPFDQFPSVEDDQW